MSKENLRKELIRTEDNLRAGMSGAECKNQLKFLAEAASTCLLMDDDAQTIAALQKQVDEAQDRVKVLEMAQQQIIDSMAFSLATARKDASREAYNHASLRLEHNMILARMAEAMSQGDPVQALDLDRGKVRKLFDWLRHGRKVTPCA